MCVLSCTHASRKALRSEQRVFIIQLLRPVLRYAETTDRAAKQHSAILPFSLLPQDVRTVNDIVAKQNLKVRSFTGRSVVRGRAGMHAITSVTTEVVCEVTYGDGVTSQPTTATNS